MESPLSIIDAIVIVLTILSAFLAMARGITREVLAVASFLGAGFVASYSADALAPLLTSSVDLYPLASKFAIEVNVVASWLTGILIFIVSWIIFTIITAKLSRFISESAVSGIDSFLGFIFGTIRGLFIVGIVYSIYTHFVSPEKYHETIVNARTKPLLDKAASIIVKLADVVLPERIAEGFTKRPEANYNQNTVNPPSTDVIQDVIKSGKLPNDQTPEDVLKQLQE